MPKRVSRNQKVHDLTKSNEFLTNKAVHQGLLLQGAQEQLDTANRFILALLLKSGGSATLTPEDYKATTGLHLDRADDGDNVVLSILQPATSGQH